MPGVTYYLMHSSTAPCFRFKRIGLKLAPAQGFGVVHLGHSADVAAVIGVGVHGHSYFCIA